MQSPIEKLPASVEAGEKPKMVIGTGLHRPDGDVKIIK